jgi:hypothetical protein
VDKAIGRCERVVRIVNVVINLISGLVFDVAVSDLMRQCRAYQRVLGFQLKCVGMSATACPAYMAERGETWTICEYMTPTGNVSSILGPGGICPATIASRDDRRIFS